MMKKRRNKCNTSETSGPVTHQLELEARHWSYLRSNTFDSHHHRVEPSSGSASQRTAQRARPQVVIEAPRRRAIMLGAQVGAGGRLGSRPRSRLDRSLANNLTLTIVLVGLFASFAIAASSAASWQPDYSRNQLIGRVAERLADLDERALVNDLRQRSAQQDEIEPDDELFLSRLRQAAEYLDAKLAGEPHEQQLEFENAPLPYGAPRYELLGARQPAQQLDNERYQYALAASGATSLPPAAPAIDNLVDSTLDDNQADSERKANLINYMLMLDKAREVERANARQQAQQQEEEEPAKTIVSLGDIGEHLEASKRQKAPAMTTLLEDEQPEQEREQKQQAGGAQQAASAGVYGKVVHATSEQLASAKQHDEAPTSIFARLKANLSYYLPFLSQMNILQRGHGAQQANQTRQPEVGSLHKESSSSTSDEFDDKQQQQQQPEGADQDTRLQPAKQSVSAAKAMRVSPDEASKAAEASKRLEVKVSVHKAAGGDQATSEHRAESKVEQDEQESGHKLGGQVRVSSTSKRLSVALADNEHDLSEMIAEQQQQQQQDDESQQSGRTFNAMRQSSLMLPLRDELLVRGAPNAEVAGDRDSLLGRYIYAPTQHYYLNALPGSSPALSSHLQQQQQQHQKAYAFQKEPGSLLSFARLIDPNGAAQEPNKRVVQSNDLYFLVMVGAFCVMAMAVVLAAGLFAYRVQQQRKASQDVDYPTYGVVGPNNMAAGGGGAGAASGAGLKSAGAAAFVNGYFSSPLVSGKSASAKHLPDLYGQAAGMDSGFEKSLSASIGSTHKKNSSSTISSAGTHTAAMNNAMNNNSNSNSNSAEPSARATNGNNLFASTAANQDAARMYHYQHQKQQMIVSDRSSAGRHTSASDLDSDEGEDDGSYTVYECPGLASAHEMEIKNPLFNDDRSP